MQEMQGTWVQSLGWEDSPKEGMETHSRILAWRIPWTEEPGGLQSMGSQRMGHSWAQQREKLRGKGARIRGTLSVAYAAYHFLIQSKSWKQKATHAWSPFLWHWNLKLRRLLLACLTLCAAPAVSLISLSFFSWPFCKARGINPMPPAVEAES